MKSVTNNMIEAIATAAASPNEATVENSVDREVNTVPSQPSTQMRKT